MSGGGTVECNEGSCGGDGSIAGDFIGGGGTIAPGNSVGVFTVEGNYAHNAGALEIELAGTELLLIAAVAAVACVALSRKRPRRAGA